MDRLVSPTKREIVNTNHSSLLDHQELVNQHWSNICKINITTNSNSVSHTQPDSLEKERKTVLIITLSPNSNLKRWFKRMISLNGKMSMIISMVQQNLKSEIFNKIRWFHYWTLIFKVLKLSWSHSQNQILCSFSHQALMSWNKDWEEEVLTKKLTFKRDSKILEMKFKEVLIKMIQKVWLVIDSWMILLNSLSQPF